MINKIKYIFHYIKVFIVSSLFFILITTLLINNTLLNKNYHIKKMNINYYDDLYIEIYESIKLNTMSSGFDETIIKTYYTKDDIKSNVLEYMDYIFEDSNNISLLSIEIKIKESVKKYIRENEIKNFDEASINAYVNAVLDIYKEKITVMNIPKIIKNKISKINKIINILDITLFVVIVLLLVFNRKKIKDYIFISINMTSMIYVFTSIMIMIKIDIKHLLVITYSVSNYIRYLLATITNFLLICGIVLMLLSVVLNVLLNINKVVKNDEKCK
ncbi:MAG: hypothetical protein E7158_05485 [Firmicutes bacterium]|nr:hypothetical protein [Bacillota bacterium]